MVPQYQLTFSKILKRGDARLSKWSEQTDKRTLWDIQKALSCKYMNRYTKAKILILGAFIVTIASCSKEPQSKPANEAFPSGIESRCSDPQGDIEIIGENSWEFVNNNADIASATIATGQFDVNSEQNVLLIGIEMFVKTNPIAELSLTGNSEAGSQSVAINISPPTPINDLLYYTIKFEQTQIDGSPNVSVTRTSADSSQTVYSSTANFENGLFSAGIPLNIFSQVGIASTWKAMSFSSLMVDTTMATASDSCEGLISNP